MKLPHPVTMLVILSAATGVGWLELVLLLVWENYRLAGPVWVGTLYLSALAGRLTQRLIHIVDAPQHVEVHMHSLGGEVSEISNPHLN